MLKILTSFYFCANKNYTSSFKIRARLSEFFKHVHPDQLAQAPVKVKEQNLRSLTNFNSYIDSISQAKPIQAKLLKFYIAEKTNLKSKKFFSFTIELPQIGSNQSNMSQQKAKKLIDNIVDVLNKKFVESKNFRTKHGKTQEDKVERIDNIKIQDPQTESERVDRMSATIKPFDKKSRLNQHEAAMLKSALNSKYMEAEKQTLSAKLRQSILFANTGNNRPIWSTIAGEQSGIYKEYQDIMEDLIDPRLIYFNEALTSDQIDQFKKKLLPGDLNRESYKASKIILEVCSKMESFDPPLCFYVSNKYSSTEIPGFFTIPYNFKATELGEYFQKQVETVVQEQQKYEQYYDYYSDIRAELQAENNLHVDQANFKNNTDIWNRILMLKRLQKYKSEKSVGVVALEKESFQIFKEKYKIAIEGTVALYEGKVVMRVDFLDADMEQIIGNLNKASGDSLGF